MALYTNKISIQLKSGEFISDGSLTRTKAEWKKIIQGAKPALFKKYFTKL